MEKSERIQHILNQINAFKESKYLRKDLINEYLELEKQIADLVLNQNNYDNKKLGLSDVYNHFKNYYIEYGKKIGKEFYIFKESSYKLFNEIRKLQSGEQGEEKAYKSLENLDCKNYIVRNLELKKDGRQVEIDFVVITQRAIFNIEVKNTKSNVRIDEKGNYYTKREIETLDCNLGEKMNDREFLLKEHLKEKGIINPKIESIVVFTNNNIDVDNQYEFIEHCYLSNLPHKISNFKGQKIYNFKELVLMYDYLNRQESIAMYSSEININEYINNLVDLIVLVERLEHQKENKKNKSFIGKIIRALFKNKNSYLVDC